MDLENLLEMKYPGQLSGKSEEGPAMVEKLDIPQIPQEFIRPTFFKPKDPVLVQTTLMPSFLQQLKQHEAAALLAQQQQQQQQEEEEEKQSRMKTEGGSTRKKSKKSKKNVKKKTMKRIKGRKTRNTKKQRK